MTRPLFPADVRARLTASGPAVPHPGPFPTVPMPATLDEAIAQFTVACEAVGGRVSRVTTSDEAAALALGYLESPEWRRTGDDLPAYVAWDEAHLPLPGVIAGLAHRTTRLEAQVSRDAAARTDDCDRLDRAIVGITGAHAALVDTGSVALVHGGGRPRLASVLPPVHIALVPVSLLHMTLGALMAAQPDLLRGAANVVLVTGPSRTADIEMTLTRGVHGPRLVHVVFVG
ncbi:MAG TPA: lactate utilization protein [Luteitalea sp.]|nr:lactate utilization protein [Luteitalea sp.]